MSLDHLTMNISYEIKTGKFEINGNITDKGHVEIIENHLIGQIGKGADKSTPNIQDTYHIKLEWYPANDEIVSSSDTGNKSLRDGLLMDILSKLTQK